MWNCDKCGAANDDRVNICVSCGAARSVGRFGAAQPQNSAAYTAQRQSAPARSSPTTPGAEYHPEPVRAHGGGGFMLMGTLLATLMFALTMVLAWRQYDAVSPVVLGLLFDDLESLGGFVCALVYAVLAFMASMLAAVPGLLLTAAGKAIRRLARIEER